MYGLFQELTNLLSKDDRLIAEGKLLKNKIVELAHKLDKELIKLLASDKKFKEIFFEDIDGILVFNQLKFQTLISNKEFLPDSFTAYKNKIGLTNEKGEFISQSKEVVLSFPYKDCVLEGGQDKEDAKRDEIFYNKILASDEIDRLLEPKVLTNFKRFDKDGEHNVNEITENDNLIIKGNNLLALHSLKKKYLGKIKVIYIDPPYNTRTDANTFAYNNTFNHSSWLVFIKNRLEIARELLTDDGIIFIDIDHYELFYLGVIADEIFGYDNRIGVLAVVHNLKGRYNEFFANSHENKLVYAKNASKVKLNDLDTKNEKDYPYEDKIGRYKSIGLQRTGDGSKREDRPNLYYPIYYDSISKTISTTYHESWVEILPIDDKGIERRWRWGKEKLEKEWKDNIEVKESKSGIKIYTKLRIDNNGEKPKTIWFKPEYSGTTGTNELKNLLGEKSFTYPKSVALVKDSLKISTNPGDIILDFFGGSGTTAQAVMELNEEDKGDRKFILVEQMDYIEDVTTKRVQAFIKQIDEGSFIRLDLMESNEKFTNEIRASQNHIEVLKRIKESGFLSHKVDLEKLDENEFLKLTEEEQRSLLMEILDANHLYVNLEDINDERFNISEEDKRLNKQFYSI